MHLLTQVVHLLAGLAQGYPLALQVVDLLALLHQLRLQNAFSFDAVEF